MSNAKIIITKKPVTTIRLTEQIGQTIEGLELHPVTKQLTIHTQKGISVLKITPESIGTNFGLGQNNSATVIDHVEIVEEKNEQD